MTFSVTYSGRLGARYTGLGAQTLAPKKGFLTSFFSVAIQQKYVEEVKMAQNTKNKQKTSNWRKELSTKVFSFI